MQYQTFNPFYCGQSQIFFYLVKFGCYLVRMIISYMLANVLQSWNLPNLTSFCQEKDYFFALIGCMASLSYMNNLRYVISLFLPFKP